MNTTSEKWISRTTAMIRAGDNVFFEPGERHWHGGNKFSRLALPYTEALTRGQVGAVSHLYRQAPSVTDLIVRLRFLLKQRGMVR